MLWLPQAERRGRSAVQVDWPDPFGHWHVNPDSTWNAGAATGHGPPPDPSPMQVEDHGSLPPRRGLALENERLRGLDHGRATAAFEQLLIWESTRPAVVLPRRGEPGARAHVRRCAARGVPLLRRESGGGAVVVGPGCLNYALVLSTEARPWLADVTCSYGRVLDGVARVLAVNGIAVRSTDLAIRDRKFAGHAQRRVRGAVLHHGVVLYDLDLVDALLPEPPRRPAWRGSRIHREFLTTAPLTRSEIVGRLRQLPEVLEG